MTDRRHRPVPLDTLAEAITALQALPRGDNAFLTTGVLAMFEAATAPVRASPELQEAIDHLCGQNFAHPFSGACVQQPFGKVTHDARFAAPLGSIGFAPTEPQVTKGLAHFLGTERRRIGAFVRAVDRACDGQLSPLCQSFDPRTAAVGAEVRVDRGGDSQRIDLLVEWQHGRSAKALVIEAKFGHVVTEDQLTGYETYADEHFNEAGLVLLMSHPRSRCGDTDRWVALSWWRLMACLEEELDTIGDRDRAFAAFREIVWTKS